MVREERGEVGMFLMAFAGDDDLMLLAQDLEVVDALLRDEGIDAKDASSIPKGNRR